MKSVKRLKQLKLNNWNAILAFWVLMSLSCSNQKKNECDYFSLIKIKNSYGYQLTETAIVVDTICAIEELLKYKGDTNIVFGGVKCYNPEWAFIYKGDKKLSVQVFALYKINKIISDTLFFNTPFPVLINERNNKTNSTYGAEVDTAYACYKRFLSEFKRTRQKYNPLDNSTVKWYIGR